MSAPARLLRKPPRPVKPRAAFTLADARTGLRLAASLPIAWALPQALWPGVARASSWLSGRISGKSTAAVAARIGRALGEREAGPALAADLRGARYEVAFQCLRGYRPGGWRPKIEVQGVERIEAALAAGKGCVLWVAHFVFSPNIAKVGLAGIGLRAAHLSRPDHGFSSSRFGLKWLNPVRAAYEDRFLSERITFDRAHPASALLRARKIVARNGLVSFTAGAWEGSSVVEAPFMASRITLAMGPVWLARASGAVLLPVFAVRTGGAERFAVEIGSPIDVGAGDDEDAAMVTATSNFLDQLEPRVLRYPGQWRGWSSLGDEPSATTP